MSIVARSAHAADPASTEATGLANPAAAAMDPGHGDPSPTARPERRRTSGWGRVLRMTRFELGMIFRQRIALMSVLLAPATAIGIAAFSKPTDDAAWRTLLPSMAMLVLIMAVYTTTTSVVVSRRETQVFKRFRTSELLPHQMLAALALPYVLVGLAQVAILTVAYQLMGAPPVSSPVALFGVALATSLMSVFAGFGTAALTSNSERVQFAVMPVMLIGLVSSIFVLNPQISDQVRALTLLVPYAAPSDLAARVLGAPADSLAAPGLAADLGEQLSVSVGTIMGAFDIVVIILWSVLFTLLAKKAWRWEPRG